MLRFFLKKCVYWYPIIYFIKHLFYTKQMTIYQYLISAYMIFTINYVVISSRMAIFSKIIYLLLSIIIKVIFGLSLLIFRRNFLFLNVVYTDFLWKCYAFCFYLVFYVSLIIIFIILFIFIGAAFIIS